jgi:hypothetical protein
LKADINTFSITESWQHAIQLLKSFERLGPSAQRCVAAMEILSAKLSKAHPSGESILPSTQGDGGAEVGTATNVEEGYFGESAQYFNLVIDLSDMSWLNICPGSHYTSL